MDQQDGGNTALLRFMPSNINPISRPSLLDQAEPINQAQTNKLLQKLSKAEYYNYCTISKQTNSTFDHFKSISKLTASQIKSFNVIQEVVKLGHLMPGRVGPYFME